MNSILVALNLVQLGHKKKHCKHMVPNLIFKIKYTYPVIFLKNQDLQRIHISLAVLMNHMQKENGGNNLA